MKYEYTAMKCLLIMCVSFVMVTCNEINRLMDKVNWNDDLKFLQKQYGHYVTHNDTM